MTMLLTRPLPMQRQRQAATAPTSRAPLLPSRPCANARRGVRVVTRVATPDKPVQLNPASLHAPSSNIVPLQRQQQHQQQLVQQETDVGKALEGTIPSLWPRLASSSPLSVALQDPHKQNGISVTFGELWDQMQQLAAGFCDLGLTKGDRVSLFSENSSRWLVADQAIMLNGCADAVRGSSAPLDELSFILHHSKSSALVLQDVDALRKMAPALKGPQAPALKFVVLLWGSRDEVEAERTALDLPPSLPLYSYDEAMTRGRAARAQGAFRAAAMARSDLATLVYTSGTTGHPKAVMLSHENLMYQVNTLHHFIPMSAGQRTLSLLPPWHIYERSTSYYVLSNACTQVYSNIRKFKTDLTTYTPDFFVCVPLVLDTLHAKVLHTFRTMQPLRKAIVQTLMAASTAFVRARRVVEGVSLQHAVSPPSLAALVVALLTRVLLAPVHALAAKLVYKKVLDAVGVRQAVISGGGSLAPHLDDFYEVVGLSVLNGWGLSETSPVLACRRTARNVRGSIGDVIPGTELRVVDPETLAPLPDGRPGLLLARGPGVMQGYLDDEAATAKAFRAGDGWFDTGDLGWRAPQGVPRSSMGGVLVLSGRAKDTIVLSSGKKVEPELIEGALMCSPLVKHVLLLGQDKRELGALIFADLDALEELKAHARPQQQQGASSSSPSSPTLTPHELEELFLKEANERNKARADYHPYEHIAHVSVVQSALSVEDGTLTRTMKPRRPEILRKYADQAAALMARLRG